MFITGIGTALPPHRYTQPQCWEALQSWAGFEKLAPRSRAILKKVLTGDSGLDGRHLAFNHLAEGFIWTPDVMQARFVEHAPALAAQAGERALQTSGIAPSSIDAVLVSTCTGYLCPGLTSYVVERLGLNHDVLALDLVGQGCGAAIPNLRAGESLVRSGHCQHALSICVEVCSAAVYIDDDPGVLISACLFGDGAGAAVVSRERSANSRAIRFRDAGTLLDPGSRELLRFEQKGGLLRNVLTPLVPTLAARHAAEVFREVTRRADVVRKDIAQWIFHAGGREVLAALRDEFNLHARELEHSTEVLRQVGNISSPFVLHVLARALEHGAPGGAWWMGSFGAGFASHGILLDVE